MKLILYFIVLTLLGFVVFHEIYSALAFGLTLTLVVSILYKSNEYFMFREWALLLYAFNYLLAPATTYLVQSEKITYAMKISSDAYFSLAFPGFLLLALGMFIIPTKIFKPNFNEIVSVALINEGLLFKLTFFGILCHLMSELFSADLRFLLYLLSLVRFVGGLALFAANPKKYRWIILLILGFEMFNGFRNAMFHDAIMWVIFSSLIYIYVIKPNLGVKLFGGVALFFFVLLIQAFKLSYRERVWVGGEAANLKTISDVGFEKANSDELVGEDNLLGALNRGNQAWIFASTVDNMDRTMDFQGMNNVNLYLEAALLPRFLAPNKITAGDKLIFNKFSGHQISGNTAMGLGVFADGYIAYGRWGVFFFTFVLGLLFSLTFKLVENWSRISPFYVLFVLPILSYAIRPDCELQTTINHLAKSILVFGVLVYLTKYEFTMDSNNVKKI